MVQCLIWPFIGGVPEGRGTVFPQEEVGVGGGGDGRKRVTCEKGDVMGAWRSIRPAKGSMRREE